MTFSGKGTFLDGELESIFMVGDADCETHDLLGCACDGRGLLPGEMEEDEAGNVRSLSCEGENVE